VNTHFLLQCQAQTLISRKQCPSFCSFHIAVVGSMKSATLGVDLSHDTPKVEVCRLLVSNNRIDVEFARSCPRMHIRCHSQHLYAGLAQPPFLIYI
jgi:hypothetical protein